MAPLHYLHQGDWNEVKNDSFGYAMPLAPMSASPDADGIVNDTIAFLGLGEVRKIKVRCTGIVDVTNEFISPDD